MTDFLNLIRSDYYGIFKRKKLIFSVLGFGWILSIVATYAYSDEAGFTFTAPVMSIIVFVFLFLFAAIAVTSVVNNNYACGLAAKKLSAGYSRDKIYLASLCSVLLMCLTLWVIFVVPMIIVGYLSGSHDLAEYTEYVIRHADENPEQSARIMGEIAGRRADSVQLLVRWIGYFAVGLLSVAGMCSFFTFISFSIRSGFVVRLICLVIVLVAVFAIIAINMLPSREIYKMIDIYDQSGNFVVSWPSFLRNEYVYEKKVMKVLAFLLFGYMKFFPPMLMVAYNDPFGGIWTYIVVAIIVFLASTAAGMAIFRKRNLK